MKYIYKDWEVITTKHWEAIVKNRNKIKCYIVALEVRQQVKTVELKKWQLEVENQVLKAEVENSKSVGKTW